MKLLIIFGLLICNNCFSLANNTVYYSVPCESDTISIPEELKYIVNYKKIPILDNKKHQKSYYSNIVNDTANEKYFYEANLCVKRRKKKIDKKTNCLLVTISFKEDSPIDPIVHLVLYPGYKDGFVIYCQKIKIKGNKWNLIYNCRGNLTGYVVRIDRKSHKLILEDEYQISRVVDED